MSRAYLVADGPPFRGRNSGMKNLITESFEEGCISADLDSPDGSGQHIVASCCDSADCEPRLYLVTSSLVILCLSGEPKTVCHVLYPYHPSPCRLLLLFARCRCSMSLARQALLQE